MPTNAEESLERLRTLLTGKGFLFAEEDKTYVIKYVDDKITMILISSQFWSRKDLAEERPLGYSLVVQGGIKQDDEGSVIELELIEYHANRPHKLGGRHIDKYLNELARSFVSQ